MAEAPKKTKGLKTTKRMAKSHEGIDPRKLHSLTDAVKLLKTRAAQVLPLASAKSLRL